VTQLPPAPAAQPPDTVKVRGRLRAVWLPLWLAAAVGCVPLGMYGDTPEDTLGSHQIFLSLFLLLAAVLVVVGVRSFGRGLDADGDGVVVRKMLWATSIPWHDLAAIDFKGVDSEALSNMYYTLVFLRQDGSRVTTDAPGGGIRPGEYLFELRERLLAMQSAALGYRQRDEDQQGDPEDSWPAYPDAPADRPSDAAGTDDEVAIPATRSRVKRWGGAAAGVAVALAFVFVPLPSSGWLLWNVGRVLHVDVMPLQVYWEDLQPGMCVRDDPNGTDYLVVDCNAEHQEEVISRSTLAGSDEWPGDAAVEDMAGEKCKPAFATYVGLELDESRFDFDFVTPDESSWNNIIPVLRWSMIGRATLICFVWDPDHDQITRALRGARE
jgi:Septum formation